MMLHPITVHNLQSNPLKWKRPQKPPSFVHSKWQVPDWQIVFPRWTLWQSNEMSFSDLLHGNSTELLTRIHGWMAPAPGAGKTCQIHWLPWMEIHCLHCVVALDGADHHLSSQSAIWNRYMVSNWRVPIAWIIIWRKPIAMCTASSHFHPNHSRLCNTFWHSCRLLRSLHRKMFNHPKFNMFHSANECH